MYESHFNYTYICRMQKLWMDLCLVWLKCMLRFLLLCNKYKLKTYSFVFIKENDTCFADWRTSNYIRIRILYFLLLRTYTSRKAWLNLKFSALLIFLAIFSTTFYLETFAHDLAQDICGDGSYIEIIWKVSPKVRHLCRMQTAASCRQHVFLSNSI